jgi:hypothetical protein
MNNRFIKALVIINGIIFPVFFGVFFYKSFSKDTNDYDYQPESVIVGDDLKKAKHDSIALQGLSYETPPEQIYNSTNMYIPISVMTYEESKNLREASQRAGDFDPGWFNYFNVLFLDKDYKVIGQLLDKKATISEIIINGGRYYYDEKRAMDTTVKNIAYRIGFDDTNKDGKLDYIDDQDLYISDLSGQNLTRVTAQKDIADFRFINSNSQIFIRYKDRNELRDEYNPLKFGIYDIATTTFKELKEIEEKLMEIETKLIK